MENPIVVTYSNGKWDGNIEHCQMAEGWYWGVPNEEGPHGPYKTRELAETEAKKAYPNEQITLK